MERKQTINAEKVLFLLAALIPVLIFGGKNKKAAGHRMTKNCGTLCRRFIRDTICYFPLYKLLHLNDFYSQVPFGIDIAIL